jgi:hypothetical protein
MQITVGGCEGWPYPRYGAVDSAPKCTAEKLNYEASAMGWQVKRVYLLPDVSVRFKGMFVAVPQIALNRSMPSRQSRNPDDDNRATSTRGC